MLNTSKLEEKTTSGFTSINQEHEAEAAVETHQIWTLEDWTNIAYTQFLLRLTDGRSEFGAICLSHGPKCLVSPVQLGWCNGVGIVFLAHFGPVNTSLECLSLFECCCRLHTSLYYTKHLITTFSMIIRHVRKQNHLNLLS